MFDPSKINAADINAFLDKASQAIACDENCQRTKTAENLKTQLMNARANLFLAKPKFEVAQKKYVTYVNGADGYNQLKEKQLTEQANKIVDKFKNVAENLIDNIKDRVTLYKNLIANVRNVLDLYKKYKIENIELTKELKDDTNDLLTNDRKTYYKDQEISSLSGYYYYALLILYAMTFVYLILLCISNPNNFSFFSRFMLLLFFATFPFYSAYVLSTIVWIVYWIFGLLPKNVYRE